METIDWGKAPEGATHYWRERNTFYVEIKGEFYFAETPQTGAVNSPRGWIASLEKRPTTQPAWSGEGLPPVGVVCEAKSMARGVERDWFSATVLYSSPYTVVLDDYQAGEFVAHPATMQFRPIRTAEQIAAEEREVAIRSIVYDLQDSENLSSLPSIASCLYGKGYRKTEGN